MKVLKLLEKIYSNWCAALESTFFIEKFRNIIDNNDDKDHGDRAWSFSLSALRITSFELTLKTTLRPKRSVHAK